MHFPKRGAKSTEEETMDFDVTEGRFISFCSEFKYLGSTLSEDLNDSLEVEKRISKATGAMHMMKAALRNKRWTSKSVLLYTKP